MGNDSFVEKLPLSHLETGLAGEKARFLYKTWRENRGLMVRSSQMTHLSPWLLLTVSEASEHDVPNVTFAGRQTTFQQFFPHALEPQVGRNPSSFLPKSYRQGVAKGYRQAIAGEPCFDIQRTGSRLGAGMPDMTLQRLLLRFETQAGFVRIFCLMQLLAIHRKDDQLDHRHHLQSCPQKSDLGPRLQAWVPPSLARDDCIL